MPTSHVQSCTAERELRLDRRGPLSARKPSLVAELCSELAATGRAIGVAAGWATAH